MNSLKPPTNFMFACLGMGYTVQVYCIEIGRRMIPQSPASCTQICCSRPNLSHWCLKMNDNPQHSEQRSNSMSDMGMQPMMDIVVSWMFKAEHGQYLWLPGPFTSFEPYPYLLAKSHDISFLNFHLPHIQRSKIPNCVVPASMAPKKLPSRCQATYRVVGSPMPSRMQTSGKKKRIPKFNCSK